MMLYCPICGYPLSSDGRCWHCGYWRKIGPIDSFIGDDEDDD